MKITYRSKKIERVCTNASEAVKRYGSAMADKIHQRIDEISSADDVDFLLQHHIGKCHALTGNRVGQYAMSLAQPYRLIFEKVEDEIQIVCVIEIVDYH